MLIHDLCQLILILIACALLMMPRWKKMVKISHETETSASETTSETSTASTSFASDGGSDSPYDVFLNFRGPDSRHTVVDVLYHSLTKAGFRVFLDDEEIPKGHVIGRKLLTAITTSRIYIPIFSKNYASSRWCLRELAIMINCWETSSGDTKKVILPIFFDVDVTQDVKLRSELYTTALQKHKKEIGEATVKLWERALREVASIKGWNLKDHGLTELTKLIQKEVFSKLIADEAVHTVPDGLVGINKSVKDIMELLEEGSPGVRFIVIHGIGGIGKTTLASVIFRKISSRFQGNCFLKDVRRSASKGDMIILQQKLLLDTCNLKSIEVLDTNDGRYKISKWLRKQDVLVVLDDVDKADQLLNLAGSSDWFSLKSRIIITTRDIGFLPNKDDQVYSFYPMKLMDIRNALKLFCQHAFKEDRPPPEYSDKSFKIIATTGRLPLALQVIGSSLNNKDEAEWTFRLKKLKEAPHEDVQETLMTSYNALGYEQKQIFLDIACLFNGEKIMDPMYFWEACRFSSENGIKTLVQRSMIKMYSDDTLWMHDQLRDLGRAISLGKMQCSKCQLHGKPNRLWSPEIALDVVQDQGVGKSIIALNLGTLVADGNFGREQFARVVKLKYLQLQGGNFVGDFKNVLQKLIWLSWINCPLEFEATNLSLKNLVILKLSTSQITEDWCGWGVFTEAKHLKILHLEDCGRLKRTPKFSTFLGLERLILRDCVGLEVIDISINKLEHLKFLEISNGKDKYSQDLLKRPQLIQGPMGKSLEVLKLENVGLMELHPSIEELEHLKLLCLRCPGLENLPDSIGKLMLLEELDISYSGIKKLPNSIGNLNRLNILRTDHSAIKYLPDTIGRLESLKELNLYRTEITQLPGSIGNLNKLKVIDVSFSEIRKLPKALGKLVNLERLDTANCKRLDRNFPKEIRKLPCMRSQIRRSKFNLQRQH